MCKVAWGSGNSRANQVPRTPGVASWPPRLGAQRPIDTVSLLHFRLMSGTELGSAPRKGALLKHAWDSLHSSGPSTSRRVPGRDGAQETEIRWCTAHNVPSAVPGTRCH